MSSFFIADKKFYSLFFLFIFLSKNFTLFAESRKDSFSDNFLKLSIDIENDILRKITEEDIQNFEKNTQNSTQKNRNERLKSNFKNANENEINQEMHKYTKENSVVIDQLCYRGDSRFPWKVWSEGGFWAKGQNSHEYSVLLHQWSPSSLQDIVSTFSSLNGSQIHATSFGLVKDMYIPKLEKYNIDQSSKTWQLNKGYVYALHIKKGVSLEKLNKNAPEYSYQKMMQKRYAWEKEVAVLGGIHKRNILAAREVITINTKSEKYKNVFTNKFFLNKKVLAADFINDNNSRRKLYDILKNLANLSQERIPQIIEELQEML